MSRIRVLSVIITLTLTITLCSGYSNAYNETIESWTTDDAIIEKIAIKKMMAKEMATEETARKGIVVFTEELIAFAEEVIVSTEETAPETQFPFSEDEINVVSKVLYNEANCVESDAERSMVVWTILNRLDAKIYGDNTTVTQICTAPYQFAYDANTAVTDHNRELVIDVMQRWAREQAGEEHVGRTLPKECHYFYAASNPAAGEWHNSFYSIIDGQKISFGYENPLENPYES